MSTRTRVRRRGKGKLGATDTIGVGLLPWILEYRDGGEWETFGAYNSESEAERIARSVFGARHPA